MSANSFLSPASVARTRPLGLGGVRRGWVPQLWRNAPVYHFEDAPQQNAQLEQLIHVHVFDGLGGRETHVAVLDVDHERVSVCQATPTVADNARCPETTTHIEVLLDRLGAVQAQVLRLRKKRSA